MKPLKLEFQAFGPYRNHETIDFDKFSEKKLFLICGETGSGKTMILDAMTFALYGKDNADARFDLGALRCNQAAFGEDTFVIFTFSNNGETYIFERKLICKKTNLSKQQNVYRVDESGNKQIVFENCKESEMKAEAERIIGLTREQFRQIIILPQGKFESFLLAAPDKKQEILSNIFDAQKWETISKKFFEKANENLSRVQNFKTSIQHQIDVFECENMEQFRALIENTVAAQKKLEEDHKKAAYPKQLKKLEAEKKTAEKFAELHQKENALSTLEAKKGLMESNQNLLNLAKKADKVKPVESEFEKARQNAHKRQTQADNAQKELSKAETEKEKAAAALTAHKQNKEKTDKKAEEKTRLETKKEIYLQIDTASAELKAAKKAFDDAKSKLDRQKKISEAAAGKVDELKKEYENNNAEYMHLFELYNNGISGELAAGLKDDLPCPVCGSTHHPHPAKKLEGAPSRQALDALKQIVDTAYSAWSEAEKNAQSEKSKSDALQKSYSECETALKLAEKNIETIYKNKVEGIESHTALLQKIRSLEAQISEYGSILEKLSADAETKTRLFAQYSADFTHATKEFTAAKQTLKQAKENLDKALKENGFTSLESAKQAMRTPEEQAAIQQDIADYKAAVTQAKTNIEALKAALDGKAEPNLESIRIKEAEIEQNIRQFTDSNASLNSKIELLNKTKESVDALNAKYNAEIRQASLKVHDNHAPDKDGRSVALLSGGEKFLVSLSLAIGMSAVAQKSGVKIEAMFIDEGFGTLDEKSIDDALEILQSVQKANGLVGIISHVQILEDNINEKLEVIKTNQGSSIKTTY